MPTKPKKQLGTITRRDGYILCQALAFAIEGLGATKYPQLSNIEDMKEILAFMRDLPITETDPWDHAASELVPKRSAP